MNSEPNKQDAVEETSAPAEAPVGDLDSEPLYRQMARYLPRAVAHGARKNQRLAEAMRPVVETSLKISTEDNPSRLVDSMFRVIGPAFRRAIADGIGRMVHRLNRFILLTVSPRGIAWRIQAFRSGRSFQDVVRERTHARRVKQVFLIHRRTGLLLELALRQDITAFDGDMVSAMLTAIQDFVHDSFSVESGERLESIQVGGTTVWLGQGRLAILAAIVDGDPPRELRQVFKDTLDTIQSEFSGELAAFDGDTSIFESAGLYLEACVRTRLRQTGEKVLPVTWFVLAAPVLMFAVLGYFHLRRSMTWNAYVSEISEQPGIVVVDHGLRQGKFYITGLRDPMALDPVAMLGAVGFDHEDVLSDWETYQALKPDLLLMRARELLKPPESVTLKMRGDVLQATGSAPRRWIKEATRLTRSLVGVSHFETNRLVDKDSQALSTWDSYIRLLESKPGIVVVNQRSESGMYHISGLRDPLAADPTALLKEVGIPPTKVKATWSPYRALDPPLVLAHVVKALEPPRTVTIEVNNDVLTFGGRASHRWISKARMLTGCMTGIGKVDTTDLLDIDMIRFTEAREEMEAMIFRFHDAGTDLWRGQTRKMNRAVFLFSQIASQARQMGLHYEIEILGHASDSRDSDSNRMAGMSIARRFLGILERQNVDVHRFTVKASGQPEPDKGRDSQDKLPKRYVSLRVLLFEN